MKISYAGIVSISSKRICYSGVLIVAAAVFSGVGPGVRAQDKTIDLLRELTNVPGPSGLEEPVRKIMVERMTPLADQIA